MQNEKTALIERLIKEDKITLTEALILCDQDINTVAQPVYVPYPVYPNPFPSNWPTIIVEKRNPFQPPWEITCKTDSLISN